MEPVNRRYNPGVKVRLIEGIRLEDGGMSETLPEGTEGIIFSVEKNCHGEWCNIEFPYIDVDIPLSEMDETVEIIEEGEIDGTSK
ncbi:MAG: hypothetical protein K0Q81_676 [Paenibacillus sp.]|jgi:hypothetical protein|nr:hypothetical protein [Paenibacillus sp.]